MRQQIKLYSLALPMILYPVVAFSFNEVGPYLKGMEFRTFLSSLISSLISGTVDAFITAGVAQAFAAFGG